MRRTVYLPDELAERVDEYLKIHRDQTLSSLIQRTLERELPISRPSILDLAGLVDQEPDVIDHAFVDRPEDGAVARSGSDAI